MKSHLVFTCLLTLIIGLSGIISGCGQSNQEPVSASALKPGMTQEQEIAAIQSNSSYSETEKARYTAQINARWVAKQAEKSAAPNTSGK